MAEVNYPIPQLVRPHASELVSYLGRPAGVKNVSSKELPAALSSLVQRSRLLDQGRTAFLSTVTISDVEKVLNTAALASQLTAAEQQSAWQSLIPEIRVRHLTLMPFTEAFSVVLPEPASEQLNLSTTGPVTWPATTNLS